MGIWDKQGEYKLSMFIFTLMGKAIICWTDMLLLLCFLLLFGCYWTCVRQDIQTLKPYTLGTITLCREEEEDHGRSRGGWFGWLCISWAGVATAFLIAWAFPYFSTVMAVIASLGMALNVYVHLPHPTSAIRR